MEKPWFRFPFGVLFLNDSFQELLGEHRPKKMCFESISVQSEILIFMLIKSLPPLLIQCPKGPPKKEAVL